MATDLRARLDHCDVCCLGIIFLLQVWYDSNMPPIYLNSWNRVGRMAERWYSFVGWLYLDDLLHWEDWPLPMEPPFSDASQMLLNEH